MLTWETQFDWLELPETRVGRSARSRHLGHDRKTRPLLGMGHPWCICSLVR